MTGLGLMQPEDTVVDATSTLHIEDLNTEVLMWPGPREFSTGCSTLGCCYCLVLISAHLGPAAKVDVRDIIYETCRAP